MTLERRTSMEDTSGWHDGVRLRFTDTAKAVADRNRLGRTLGMPSLPGNALCGDHVVVVHEGETLRFSVMRRAWVATGDRWVLEITLDHPAR